MRVTLEYNVYRESALATFISRTWSYIQWLMGMATFIALIWTGSEYCKATFALFMGNTIAEYAKWLLFLLLTLVAIYLCFIKISEWIKRLCGCIAMKKYTDSVSKADYKRDLEQNLRFDKEVDHDIIVVAVPIFGAIIALATGVAGIAGAISNTNTLSLIIAIAVIALSLIWWISIIKKSKERKRKEEEERIDPNAPKCYEDENGRLCIVIEPEKKSNKSKPEPKTPATPFAVLNPNMFCKNCGSRLASDSVFCPACGTRKGTQAPTQFFCKYCGKPLGEGSFCKFCGKKIEP